ncbi:MAG: acyl-CoA dehydrogenase [Acidobacteria bacterium RIFCSPLOWO2_02_FULL_61_28]|nr:MAG: acyl-CoA dehydrogenase [Acidobacteria bacterium RIFCSPLOWO2_02_FULL_61_28]
MDFDLNDELLAIQEAARKFAEKEVAPTVDEDDREHRFRKDLVQKMGELGFFGCIIPEEYGGTNTGFVSLVIITEEIGRIHSSLRVAINMQIGPARALLDFASEDLKQRYLSKIANAELLSCFAITEPDAGSDVAAMRTRATRDGAGYVLNGSKTWISNAQVADVALVYAYTDPEKKHRGISAFMVDLPQPGVTAKAIADKLGANASPTGELFFDNCKVPRENLVGNEGDGFKICMTDLNYTRLSCGAGAVGLARACREASVQYANQRVQFGQKIGEYQMIQDMIAQMLVQEDAARLLLYRAAALKDQGRPNNLETSMAKYYAGETAAFAADCALKIYGAWGYSKEYPIERYFRDSRSYQIVEGSANIQKLIIAQDALGYRKANR